MKKTPVYIVQWFSGDGSHAYAYLSDAVQELRSYPEREGALIIADAGTGEVTTINLSAVR